ncbi:MAG: hypothetical protein ACOCP8_02395 [archaeon]
MGGTKPTEIFEDLLEDEWVEDLEKIKEGDDLYDAVDYLIISHLFLQDIINENFSDKEVDKKKGIIEANLNEAKGILEKSQDSEEKMKIVFEKIDEIEEKLKYNTQVKFK